VPIICTNFDVWVLRWHEEIYRFCLVLVLDATTAKEMVFQAYLRLGVSRPNMSEADARSFLYAAAFRVCNAYQLKKLRRKPSQKSLRTAFCENATEPFSAYLRKPFLCRASAFLLHIASFKPEAAGQIIGVSPSRAKRLGNMSNMAAIASACFALRRSESSQNDLSARLYMRFSERNVAFETRMMDMRQKFDSIVPYLALFILLLFVYAIYRTGV